MGKEIKKKTAPFLLGGYPYLVKDYFEHKHKNFLKNREKESMGFIKKDSRTWGRYWKMIKGVKIGFEVAIYLVEQKNNKAEEKLKKPKVEIKVKKRIYGENKDN